MPAEIADMEEQSMWAWVAQQDSQVRKVMAAREVELEPMAHLPEVAWVVLEALLWAADLAAGSAVPVMGVVSFSSTFLNFLLLVHIRTFMVNSILLLGWAA